MATLKISVLKHKRQANGKYKIFVSVNHQGVTSYIPTRFSIDDLSQFKDGQVIKRNDSEMLNRKLRDLLNKYYDKLDRIENQGSYSCSTIKRLISTEVRMEGETTYQSFCADFIRSLKRESRIAYATLCERSCRYFTQYLHGEIQLRAITPQIVQGFAYFLENEKRLSKTTAGMMLGQIKAIVNRAIQEQYVNYQVHPFVQTKIGRSPIRELDISLKDIQAIKDMKPTSRKIEVARDIFLLSFYLGGINLIDLVGIDFRGDKIDYIRIKVKDKTTTKRHVIIPVIKQARAIVDKYIGNDGKLNFNYNLSYHNFSCWLTHRIKEIAEILGIEGNVCYNSARKTFAQLASELYIPDNIIDYCLGHSDDNRGIIRYYSRVREKQAAIALTMVADYIENPEKYDNIINLRQQI